MKSGKKIYKIHQWCGLAAGIVILLLGISGSILVFHEELERLEFNGLLSVENGTPVNIDKAYRTIRDTYADREVRLQRFTSDPSKTLIFSIRHPEKRQLTVFVHPSDGSIIREVDSKSTFTNWLLTLHYSLHASLTGKIIVFIAGIAFLISLITGVIVYRRALLKVILFKVNFKNTGTKSLSSSLHRYTGVWALIFNLIIVISGVLISYDIMVNGIKIARSPIVSPVSTELHLSIDQVLKELAARNPEFQPSYIRFPVAEGGPLRISGKVEGQGFYWSKYYNYVSIDPVTSEISPLTLNPEAPNPAKLASIVRAVHFLEFGNLPIKIFVCLVGLSAPILTITGFLLWKLRKKRVVRPVSMVRTLQTA